MEPRTRRMDRIPLLARLARSLSSFLSFNLMHWRALRPQLLIYRFHLGHLSLPFADLVEMCALKKFHTFQSNVMAFMPDAVCQLAGNTDLARGRIDQSIAASVHNLLGAALQLDAFLKS